MVLTEALSFGSFPGLRHRVFRRFNHWKTFHTLSIVGLMFKMNKDEENGVKKLIPDGVQVPGEGTH